MISALLSAALAEDAGAARLEDWLTREAPGAPRNEVQELAELLGGYLRGVPSAIDALTAMTKDQRVGRAAAFAAGQALLYLVDEDDLFRDEELGALGLLDDAYLIHACVVALRATFPGLEVPAGYQAPDDRARTAVRALLPAGVPEALDRTCENLVRVAATLFGAGGGQDGPAPPPSRPPLRVSDALAGLAARPDGS
jgi:hypothetical protein